MDFKWKVIFHYLIRYLLICDHTSTSFNFYQILHSNTFSCHMDVFFFLSFILSFSFFSLSLCVWDCGIFLPSNFPHQQQIRWCDSLVGVQTKTLGTWLYKDLDAFVFHIQVSTPESGISVNQWSEKVRRASPYAPARQLDILLLLSSTLCEFQIQVM